MGICTCVGKDIDQTNKNSLNVSELEKINVPSDEVSVFCKTNKFMFFEISMKTNLKINILIQSVIKVYDSKAYPFID